MVTDPPESISIREWKWRLVVAAAVFALAGVCGGVAMVAFRGGLNPVVLGGAAALWIGVVGYAALSYRRDGIREVRVADRGVEFILGREVLRVGWADLGPPRYPVSFGDISFHFPGELGPEGAFGTDRGRVAVTKRQALAILRHPKCPSWTMSDQVRTSLGI